MPIIFEDQAENFFFEFRIKWRCGMWDVGCGVWGHTGIQYGILYSVLYTVVRCTGTEIAE